MVSVQAVNTRDLIEEIDLAEYKPLDRARKPSSDDTRLGRVLRVVDDAFVVMEPLLEEEEGVFVADESKGPEQVPASALVKVVQYELSQRQDKVSNPHGEHAHDIYRILEPLTTRNLL